MTNSIEDEQNGFRKNRSCLHHIFSLLTLARNSIKLTKKGLYAVYIGFRKAFDYINRDLLVHLLEKTGVRGRFLELIKTIHTNTSNVIRLNGLFSDSFLSTNGVLQGNTASPTLFSVYINGLIQELKNTNVGVCLRSSGSDADIRVPVLAYADDLVLLSETEDGMQQLLDKTLEWCSKWRVQINTDKTKVMHFRRKRVPPTKTIFKLGDDLEMVETYKYLGFWVDSHVDSHYGISELAKSGSRSLGGVIGKTRDHYDLSFSCFTKLMETCVEPILDYASGAWSVGRDAHPIDKVQQRSARFYCGLPKSTSLPCLIGETGWVPCVVRRDIKALRLYNQLVKMDPRRLTRRIFEHDCSIKGDWSVNIEKIMDAVGKLDLFQSRSVVNVRDCKTKLLAMYEQAWVEHMHTKPKLRTYVQLKDKIETEPYLKIHLPKIKRALISRIRCAVLSLKIETGQFKGQTLNQRICELCDSEVETETHFLFKCPKLVHVRDKYRQRLAGILDWECGIKQFKTLNSMPYLFGSLILDLWNERESQITNLNSV